MKEESSQKERNMFAYWLLCFVLSSSIEMLIQKFDGTIGIGIIVALFLIFAMWMDLK